MLWNKGSTSGHTQRVLSVSVDCDADALLYRVVPNGPACHTGATSCFTATVPLAGAETAPDGAQFERAVGALARTIAARKSHPVEGSYTAKLFAGGVDRISKKIGEEATEVVIAAKNADRGRTRLGNGRSAVPHARAAGGARRLARRGGSGAIATRQTHGLSGSARAKHGLFGLAGIGPETAAKFAEVGVRTPGDLLAYVPRAYRDWREPSRSRNCRKAKRSYVGRILRVKERKGRSAAGHRRARGRQRA